jgi:hypothetical protein
MLGRNRGATTTHSGARLPRSRPTLRLARAAVRDPEPRTAGIEHVVERRGRFYAVKKHQDA